MRASTWCNMCECISICSVGVCAGLLAFMRDRCLSVWFGGARARVSCVCFFVCAFCVTNVSNTIGVRTTSYIAGQLWRFVVFARGPKKMVRARYVKSWRARLSQSDEVLQNATLTHLSDVYL